MEENNLEIEQDVVTTEIVCPNCEEVIVMERVIPQRRGVLAGLTLKDMDDEQLKIEIRNAKSVLYKATKREASDETILNNQARVDAAMEEKASREPATEEEVTAGEIAEEY